MHLKIESACVFLIFLTGLRQFCPWTDHLFDLEAADGVQVKYVVFADTTDNSWRIRAVPVQGESFAVSLLLFLPSGRIHIYEFGVPAELVEDTAELAKDSNKLATVLSAFMTITLS